MTGTCRLSLKGASQIRHGRVRTTGSPPALEGEGLPAPKASADREREEAEPYVRAAHVGSNGAQPVSPGGTVRRKCISPPASRHFSPPCLAVNQLPCASRGRASWRGGSRGITRPAAVPSEVHRLCGLPHNKPTWRSLSALTAGPDRP
ncbi:hypothetical protein GCM10022207_23310 [Streptomyces lannensis]|uniref:Uncharacterized protein n=1 Tax=Streptomyces lannensis TaxID=766498 RepID=A0ABP7JYE8_9ACTN